MTVGWVAACYISIWGNYSARALNTFSGLRMVPSVVGLPQRGLLRPQGSACDIGAYEYPAVAVATPIPSHSEWSMMLLPPCWPWGRSSHCAASARTLDLSFKPALKTAYFLLVQMKSANVWIFNQAKMIHARIMANRWITNHEPNSQRANINLPFCLEHESSGCKLLTATS